MQSPMGEVVDVSVHGFRLADSSKPKLKVGETHTVTLRAGGQQVRVAARVQWLRRASLWPARYEFGFLIVDSRPGVGEAVQQLGQFGCIGQSTVAGEPKNDAPQQKAKPNQEAGTEPAGTAKRPADFVSVELEDLYALLGVEPDATDDAIRDAYRKRAKACHPDTAQDGGSTQQFELLTSAYSILRDPRRRKWYDEMRTGGTAA